MEATAKRVSCGLDFPAVKDITATLQEASKNCYDFISVPITHPRFKREFIKGPAKDRLDPFAKLDLILSSEEWSNAVVAKTSSYIDCESLDYTVRKQSEQTLQQELKYILHLAVPVVLISLTKPNNANLARIINSFMCERRLAPRMSQIWIKVPLVSPSVQTRGFCAGSSEAKSDSWKWWNMVRCLCNHERRVNCVLELTSDLPSSEEMQRWLGEPVVCIVVPTHLFLTNKKGFPVLSREHQDVLQPFLNFGTQVIVSGASRHHQLTYYCKYIDHMLQMMQSVDYVNEFAYSFEDHLQVPLQPLMDNLDSGTYEVFEKDPVKYSEYGRAISMALRDRVPEDQKETNTQVVMVVGAGRGPLVSACLLAAKTADRKIKVYAVEKNPNAVVTLLGLKEELFKDKVTIVSSDMREWKAPELADIIVSELLGSFSDNELSPECLDGAQKFLKEDGISIPCSYTSYLVPIHSPKLYGEVFTQSDSNKPSESYSFETPFVCHQQTKFQLADIQPLFTYYHPNTDSVIDNSRYKCLKFPIKTECLLHGFSGYFDTVLYKDVFLSIEPSTYSDGMVSWFPIFFPIKNPVPVKPGDEVVVHFWRLHDKKDVWYEWTITSPQSIPVHNPNGRAYNIGLF